MPPVAEVEENSVTISRSPTSALDFPVEANRCPHEHCNSVIPATHIVTDGKRLTCRIFCPSCERVYEVAIRYVRGVAHAVGEVRLIDAKNSVKAMKAIVALRTE